MVSESNARERLEGIPGTYYQLPISFLTETMNIDYSAARSKLDKNVTYSSHISAGSITCFDGRSCTATY